METGTHEDAAYGLKRSELRVQLARGRKTFRKPNGLEQNPLDYDSNKSMDQDRLNSLIENSTNSNLIGGWEWRGSRSQTDEVGDVAASRGDSVNSFKEGSHLPLSLAFIFLSVHGPPQIEASPMEQAGNSPKKEIQRVNWVDFVAAVPLVPTDQELHFLERF
ncbi:hypothetical protein OIU84_008536 [Salix udensis]|uniref:Uncharacterized protein n=1 Tax=Salix udensis TaxID=889485 RepID=A0AAD6JPK1_9ROSI|nr:hypothetical protein OIU84_008536 [Salix udensis]